MKAPLHRAQILADELIVYGLGYSGEEDFTQDLDKANRTRQLLF